MDYFEIFFPGNKIKIVKSKKKSRKHIDHNVCSVKKN